MKPTPKRRLPGLALVAGLVCALHTGLEAQAGREQLRQGISAFVVDGDYDRALPLLLRGVNPLAGPRDSTWALGVQYIAQMMFEEDDDVAAIQVWANWASRHGDDVVIDSIALFEEVITAFSTAAATTSTDRDDSTKETTWVWSGNPGIDQGGVLDVRANVAATITVVGEGVFAAGASFDLAAGSYAMTAELAGYESITLTREILPGARTIVTLQLTPVVTVAAALRSIGMLTISRFGLADSCATGVFASSNGLLVTTYSAIRGGDDATVQLPDGRVVTAGIQVAAHDAERNVAILRVPNVQTTALEFVTDIDPNQETAVIGFPSCGAATVEPVRVVSVPGDPDETVLLDRTATTAHQGGPLVVPDGVLGLSAGADSVVPTARFTALLQTARSNAASGQLKTLGEVAVQENHQFGAVAVQSDEPGSVLITPTEASQWASLRDSAATPVDFVGPIGTYAFAFFVGGQLRQQGEFSVQPGTTMPFLIPAATAGDPQLEVQGSGGGFPVLWVVLGAAAAGVGAFLLLGGSPPTEGTGTTTITINVP